MDRRHPTSDGDRPVRIAGIVGVKDEAGLIVPCIERLRAVGVDPIVVLDDHSTDGTAELVDRLALDLGAGSMRVLRDGDPDELFTRDGPLMGPLIERHAPDWILFTDADEFWVAADGGLDTALRSVDVDALAIERYNVPLMEPPFAPPSGTPDDPFLDVPIIVRRQKLTRSLMDLDPGRLWITHAIMPRVLCRTDRFGSYMIGGHGVRDIDGVPVTAPTTDRIVVVHVPFTNLERFARKVDNARVFLTRFAAQYSGESAWHWRRWIEAADAGRSDAEFERERMTASMVRRLTEDGAIATARDLLGLGDRPWSPGAASGV